MEGKSVIVKFLYRSCVTFNLLKVDTFFKPANGVAFLENSDDTRNTPSATLYYKLKKRGAKPVLHDLIVQRFEIPFTHDLDEAVIGADAVVLAIKHKESIDRSKKNS